MRVRTRAFWIGIGIVGFIIAGCATGSAVVSPRFYETNPDAIGVVAIRGDISRGAPENQVDDFFSMELMAKGYRVIERRRVQSILAEQNFQHSDRTSAEGAAEMGRILNVPAVAMLDVHVDGEKVSMTCRIVDTQTAEVIFIGGGRGGSGQRLATVAGAIGGAAAGMQMSDRAAIAGGVLGGTAGHTLSPQAARVVQRAIQEAIKDLPRR